MQAVPQEPLTFCMGGADLKGEVGRKKRPEVGRFLGFHCQTLLTVACLGQGDSTSLDLQPT